MLDLSLEFKSNNSLSFYFSLILSPFPVYTSSCPARERWTWHELVRQATRTTISRSMLSSVVFMINDHLALQRLDLHEGNSPHTTTSVGAQFSYPQVASSHASPFIQLSLHIQSSTAVAWSPRCADIAVIVPWRSSYMRSVEQNGNTSESTGLRYTRPCDNKTPSSFTRIFATCAATSSHPILVYHHLPDVFPPFRRAR